ncbi:peptide chain release factor N(5)-glutamine methyltransferase [Syntrophomonas wolfei]|uniref:Release factor glutamine methyltransferase n=1 Tax=Syntrophomonas wolfei subsp. wolfei (strain DSM 2245B / Goettingen) TaxID=335541 RepID=Q0AUB9_SYNWW|nr:peptide chain release factor N(5)-glutamine methyltransferase [Syntrophomonas wolfei]ABI69685.1 peptide release factor-glutamine N5-methyltransferase [Syntrophomonas wolfei subsp. wolfei str. Goettingen G311]
MQQQWLIKELMDWTTRFFADRGLEEPRLEAEVLLAHVLLQNRVYLYTHFDKPVNQEERQQYREVIKRRIKGEPLAYIVGHKEFMSLEFKLNQAVLIPRPETELLVEEALEIAEGKEGLRICDVGTGSGAIAVSLAFYVPTAQVYATDISADALEKARENATRHGVAITFYQGDLLFPLLNEEPFDIIVANLPYIGSKEFILLDSGVKDYEPALALLAPGDGLDLYRRLLPQAAALLAPEGCLLLEIGHEQGSRAREMMQGWGETEIIKDLAGRDRLLKSRRE